jgi:transcriptional regulator with XRE-family HTH domain
MSNVQSSQPLATALRKVRLARKTSQLELSMQIGVSQRHISFVESGRAKPSRELLSLWLHELKVPFTEHNAIMLQGGFAPTYHQTELSNPALAEAKLATEHLMASHDPFPCFVLDAFWNVVSLNRGGHWLAKTLIPKLQNERVGTSLNMLDLLCDPEGFTKNMLNLKEVGPHLLSIIKSDTSAHPAIEPKLIAFERLLQKRLGGNTLRRTNLPASAIKPFLITKFSSEFGELSFFSMFTTFGMPQDITLSSLKIEHVFAANKATRGIVREQVLGVRRQN